MTPEDRALARDVERLYRGRTRDRVGLHGKYDDSGRWLPAPAEERAMRFVDALAPTKGTERRDKPGAPWAPQQFCTRRLIAAVAISEPEHFQFCLKAMDERYARSDKRTLSDLKDGLRRRTEGFRGVHVRPVWWGSQDVFDQAVDDYAAGRKVAMMDRELPEADVMRAWRLLEDLRVRIARVEAVQDEEEKRLADLGL